MLPIRFEDITVDDIVRLVNDKVSERKTLEYKQRLSIGNTDERAEFLADISSFANASGGDILFGISDVRDGARNATGLPDKIVGLAIDSAGTACNTIEQLIRDGIQPRLPILLVNTFDIPERGKVIVIRVGQSWIAPHMVSYANRTRFFSRNSSTGKIQLDVQQIGAAFAQQRGVGERLRAWKTGRISKAISGEGPVEMKGPRLLYHFIPMAAVMADSQPHPRIFDGGRWDSNRLLMSLSPRWSRYNADGLLLGSEQKAGICESYLQVFKDGTMEYGDSWILGANSSKSIPSAILEQHIVRAFERAFSLLKLLEVSAPIYVTLTLIGVKGATMSMPYNPANYSFESHPFDRDVIVCPEVEVRQVEEERPYPNTLLPIVNTIWQAAGSAQTPNIHQGRWIVSEC